MRSHSRASAPARRSAGRLLYLLTFVIFVLFVLKTILSISLFSCFLAVAAFATDGSVSVSEDAEPPSSNRTDVLVDVGPAASARAVLDGMLARFPRDPIVLTGRLIRRRQGGFIESETPFSMALDWGASPATAVYSIFDNFHRVVTVAKISRAADGTLSMAFEDGNGKKLPSPPVTDAIAGTDITWLDLSLSYLWWPDAKLDGEEEFRGALCDRVIVTPPEPLPDCSSVRLWIDRKRGVLRQVEQLDADGKRQRWMWVASVGKINDQWMIRNLEVKRPNTGRQTKLHVDDLETP